MTTTVTLWHRLKALWQAGIFLREHPRTAGEIAVCEEMQIKADRWIQQFDQAEAERVDLVRELTQTKAELFSIKNQLEVALQCLENARAIYEASTSLASEVIERDRVRVLAEAAVYNVRIAKAGLSGQVPGIQG